MKWFATRLDSRSGGTVMMAGEAGIGKSRLLGEILARATAAGYVTAVGVCPGEGETPMFGPWQEALNNYAAATGRPLTPLPPPFGEGKHPESIRGHAAAVARFLSAGPGAVLSLEDIHWADSGSLDLLRHLAGRLAGGPVLVVATYRADALHRNHPLYAILRMLDRSGAHRITLEQAHRELTEVQDDPRLHALEELIRGGRDPTGSTFVLVRTHRLLGALGGLRAQQHLATALDLAQRAGYLYEEALVRLERRTPEDLLAARAILERLGARPDLARADAALTHVGPPDGAGLTPRQLDIVRLVTQGLIDREIGARLHISVRTVDTHLRNIFGKTGVASRSGLVAWAARQGLMEDA